MSSRSVGNMIIRSRKGDIWDSPNTGVGPGDYDPVVPSFKPKHAMAPFMSTAERRTGEPPLDTPGPGAYSAQRSTLYVSTHPSHQFISKSERMMGEGMRNRDINQPGPGHYTGDIINVPKGTSCHLPLQPIGINWMKIATPPSIPGNGQNTGYEEGLAGMLIQQPSLMRHTGIGQDLPGPGSYDVSLNAVKTHGRICIGFGKVPTPIGGAAGVPGPGSYDIRNIGENSASSKKNTSMFNSKSKRSKLTNESYGPGPGAFDVVSNFKSRSEYRSANPVTFSAFGSSSKNARYEFKHDEPPGPGTYVDDINPPRQGNGARAAFHSGSNRFSDVKCEVPGPGTYDRDITAQRKNVKGGGSFGSSSARFEKDRIDTAPPVGHYNVPSNLGNTADMRRADLRMSSFRSTSTRAQSNTIDDRPLIYDVKHDWPKPHAVSNVFISSIPRFPIVKDTEAVPGPGSYNLVGQLKRNGPGFGKNHRFAADNLEDTPGPGYYHTPGDLNKNTFNVTIGDESTRRLRPNLF